MLRLSSISAKLEVVTPLFLGGANPAKAELRPTSIWNLMAWWFRAGFGSNFQEMIKREAELFGSIRVGSEISSRFIRRIGEPKVSKRKLTRNEFDSFDGLSYLAGQALFNRDYIVEASSAFAFNISSLPGVSWEDWKTILGSLWLLIWLGGVGSRNRRGFGSLRIKEEISTGELKFKFTGSELEQLKDFLEQGIKTALNWINPVASTRSIDGLPKHTMISKDCSIYLWNNQFFNNWQLAMHEAGKLMMEFRAGIGPEYKEVNQYIQTGNPPKAIERAAFGLPLQFYYRSIEKQKLAWLIKETLIKNKKWKCKDAKMQAEKIAKIGSRKRREQELCKIGLDKEARQLIRKARKLSEATVSGEKEKHGRRSSPLFEKEKHGRRSSPLFIKVIKVKDQYALLFIFMKAELLPGKNLKIESENQKRALVPKPSFELVEKFLEEKVVPNSVKVEVL